jgi:hypothetical protein
MVLPVQISNEYEGFDALRPGDASATVWHIASELRQNKLAVLCY